jgi:hypothetical protein
MVIRGEPDPTIYDAGKYFSALLRNSLNTNSAGNGNPLYINLIVGIHRTKGEREGKINTFPSLFPHFFVRGKPCRK